MKRTLLWTRTQTLAFSCFSGDHQRGHAAALEQQLEFHAGTIAAAVSATAATAVSATAATVLLCIHCCSFAVMLLHRHPVQRCRTCPGASALCLPHCLHRHNGASKTKRKLMWQQVPIAGVRYAPASYFDDSPWLRRLSGRPRRRLPWRRRLAAVQRRFRRAKPRDAVKQRVAPIQPHAVRSPA